MIAGRANGLTGTMQLRSNNDYDTTYAIYQKCSAVRMPACYLWYCVIRNVKLTV